MENMANIAGDLIPADSTRLEASAISLGYLSTVVEHCLASGDLDALRTAYERMTAAHEQYRAARSTR